MRSSIERVLESLLTNDARRDLALAREAKHCLSILENDFGHAASRRTGSCVDAEGNPIPWYTYPTIEFLKQIDFSDRSVFEYGCGFSTLFWGENARSVVSVEHNKAWYEKVRSMVGHAPIALLQISEKDPYVHSIGAYPDLFDVVIVDGVHRYACVKEAAKRVKAGGLVILDNSDWYPRASSVLRDADLIQVDMAGFGPINDYTWTTSLFLHRGYDIKPRFERQPVCGIGSSAWTDEDDGR